MRWLDAVVPWAELAAKRVARGAADAVTRAAVVKFEDLDGRADDGDDDDNNEEYGVLVGTTRDDALAALLRHLLSCFKIDDRGEIDVDDDANRALVAAAGAAFRRTGRGGGASETGAAASTVSTASPMHAGPPPPPPLREADLALARRCVDDCGRLLRIPLKSLRGGRDCLLPGSLGLKGRAIRSAPRPADHGGGPPPPDGSLCARVCRALS